MSVPISKWQWFGHAGHFVAASKCRFHMHTRVGYFRISTVGDYRPRDGGEPETIGVDRLYETFVFNITGECDCEYECGQGECDWDEIDSLPANGFREAEANHMTMCRKYAKQ